MSKSIENKFKSSDIMDKDKYNDFKKIRRLKWIFKLIVSLVILDEFCWLGLNKDGMYSRMTNCGRFLWWSSIRYRSNIFEAMFGPFLVMLLQLWI